MDFLKMMKQAKQMQEQMAAAPEPEPEPESAAGDEAGAPTAVDLGISFQDALGQVRSEHGSLNWLLASESGGSSSTP